MVHWRREWKITSVFLPRELHEQYEKAKNDMTLEDGPPKSGVQCATGEEERAMTNSSERMEWLGQSGNNAQLWLCLVVKVKPNAVKNTLA